MIKFSRGELAKIVSEVGYAKGRLEAEKEFGVKDFDREIESLESVKEKIISKIEDADSE